MKITISLDGGGQRGLATVHILAWLEEQTGQPISAIADLIVGTSTGGIAAATLTHTTDGKTPTYSANQIESLYLDHGVQIFHRDWYRELALLRVKYSAGGIEGVLRKYLGDAMLSQALGNVLITAFDEVAYEPRFFKSHKARVDQIENAPLWYAARATSAAPTYFPNIDGLIDGGVMGATNPSMIALTEARILWPGEDVFLLSIGTGRKHASVNAVKSAEWGQLASLSTLIDILLDAPERTVERMVRESMPADRLVRVQGIITTEGPSPHMDVATPENNAKLIALADKMIADNQEGLQRFVALATPIKKEKP